MAEAYLAAADLVLEDSELDADRHVAVGNAVLAGIAASDAICCVRLRKCDRGEDHRGAADLLRQAVPDGRRLSQQLQRLLGLKDAGHYGTRLISAAAAAQTVTRARRLVERAREERER